MTGQGSGEGDLLDMAAGLASWCVQDGDAREVLPLMEEGSVQACITSPPYWGLRQYKIGKWVGGDPSCGHKPRRDPKIETSGGKSTTGHQVESPGSTCPWCGATQEGLPIWDGDPKCSHQWGESSPVKRDRQHLAELGERDGSHGGKKHSTGEQYEGATTGAFCQDCGAWRGQLGLEPEPEMYVRHLVEILRLVRRVLRDDGLLWVVIGDTRYTAKGSMHNPGGGPKSRIQNRAKEAGELPTERSAPNRMLSTKDAAEMGMKPKDLVGIPYMLAFALRADGWYWRSIAPFVKTNAMPESTTDRPSVSHEQVLMFAKSKTYYYDRVAVLRPLAQSSIVRITQETFDQQHGGEKDYGEQASGVNPNRSARRSLENLAIKYRTSGNVARRVAGDASDNARLNTHLGSSIPWDPNGKEVVGRQWRTGDVFFDSLAEVVRGMKGMLVDQDGDPLAFNVPVNAGKTKHFATFPETLIAPAIAASAPPLSCSGCGAPYIQGVISTSHPAQGRELREKLVPGQKYAQQSGWYWKPPTMEAGNWAPSCRCAKPSIPSTILDPFCGTGTTGVVALKQGKRFIGIELSPEYVEGARVRLRGVKVDRATEVPSE